MGLEWNDGRHDPQPLRVQAETLVIVYCVIEICLQLDPCSRVKYAVKSHVANIL